MTQFLCESLLLTFLAGVSALVLAYFLLPFFNDLIQQQLDLNIPDYRFWLTGLLIIIFVGILAGIYPAFYLSSFKPVKVLKGSAVSGSGRNFLRRLLVVFQFGLAITLIFSVVVVRKQIIHLQNRQTGYDRNGLIYHSISGDLDKSYVAYKNELLQSGLVQSVTKTSSPITENWSSTFELEWEGKDPQSRIVVDRFYVDENITTTAGIHLVKGRDMDLQKYPSDSAAVLINESAWEVMGFQDPINQIIKDSNREWHIIGVVKDFILSSPGQKIGPMMLQGGKGWFSAVHLRLNDSKPIQECITGISKIFEKYDPVFPFDYHFVDEIYNRKFSGIEKTLLITTIFSAVAIFIACLGLIGLSIYLIESKTKEIGVRKVLGGSAMSIGKLLCLNILKPIFIAIILFTPQAWLSMEWWLQSYEYRISPDLLSVLIAGSSLLIIALLTISIQTIMASRANPVNALKID